MSHKLWIHNSTCTFFVSGRSEKKFSISPRLRILASREVPLFFFGIVVLIFSKFPQVFQLCHTKKLYFYICIYILITYICIWYIYCYGVIAFASGHTMSNAPDPIRTRQLIGIRPGQYWGGGPPGKPFGCCWLFFFAFLRGQKKNVRFFYRKKNVYTCKMPGAFWSLIEKKMFGISKVTAVSKSELQDIESAVLGSKLVNRRF